MKSILDKSFRYTPSAQTDLKKTFARLRREKREADVRNKSTNVTTLPHPRPNARKP